MEKQTSASCILHPLLVCRGGKIQPSLKNSDEISNKTKKRTISFKFSSLVSSSAAPLPLLPTLPKKSLKTKPKTIKNGYLCIPVTRLKDVGSWGWKQSWFLLAWPGSMNAWFVHCLPATLLFCQWITTIQIHINDCAWIAFESSTYSRHPSNFMMFSREATKILCTNVSTLICTVAEILPLYIITLQQETRSFNTAAASCCTWTSPATTCLEPCNYNR